MAKFKQPFHFGHRGRITHRIISIYLKIVWGESSNIQWTGVNFHTLTVVPYQLPYKDKNGCVKRWEQLNNIHLDKYRKLVLSNKERPFNVGFVIVTLDESRIEVSMADIDDLALSQENKEVLKGHLSLDNFMRKLVISLQ